MLIINLKVILIAITSVCLLSFSRASTGTTVFYDDFAAFDTDEAATISDPTNRGDSDNNGFIDGSHNDTIRYKFGGNIVVSDGTKKDTGADENDPFVPDGDFVDSALRIHNNALDFSAGLPVNGNKQITAPDTDSDSTTAGPFTRDIGFVDASGNAFDWSTVQGIGQDCEYEISFQMHAAHNNPLAFSISDHNTQGRYNAHKFIANNGDTPYDFGMNTWDGHWKLGEDANVQTGIADDSYTIGTSYHVRVLIDESNPQATASVFIDGNTSALHEFDIDFENNGRYFQFNARDNYGGTLDDLKITTYSAVPELNNFSLLTSLLLVTGLFVIRRSPQV